MANDNVSLSSASISSVVSSDTSGRKAAQPLSAQSDVSALSGKDGVSRSDATAVAQAEVTSSAMSGADETQQAKELQQTKELQQQEMEKQAQDLQVVSESKGWNVSFRVDNELNQTIIRVIDSDTQETIRQIPNEELLSISKRIQAFREGEETGSDLAGLLFDRQA